MASSKPRNRGAIYPYEFVVRLDKETGDRIDALLGNSPSLTKVGIVRKALERHLTSIEKPELERTITMNTYDQGFKNGYEEGLKAAKEAS